MLIDNLDPYFKKIVQYDYRGINLNFRVSQMLFSSQGVDHGTQRLLRSFIFEKIDTYHKVLDFGCGYGPIGIALKRFCPTSIIHMVDRDALALEFSRQNSSINNVNDIKIYASLGYDDIIDTDFDLIASNIPAKIGEKALEHVLKDARFYLRPGGRAAVVVIGAIADYVERALASDTGIKILFRRAWPGHVVFHYSFIENKTLTKPKVSAFDRGIFDREKNDFSVGSLDFIMQTAYGLSEFDTLSYETKLLIDNLRYLKDHPLGNVVIFNPGQGYIAVALSLHSKINNLILIGRDLQSLRVSKRNLMLNSYPEKNIFLLHQIDMSQISQEQADHIVGVFDEKDGLVIHSAYMNQAASHLSEKGLIIISSTSTAITRIEKFIRTKKNLEILEKKKLKGRSLIMIKHKN
ncbi:MAG: methyltransferase [Candidatus Levybacteria bacterium]|nr:methyltransferase [Candidatus Levybacteria bacterium]